jgi:uncharacterized RDD family membrane protein YckC
LKYAGFLRRIIASIIDSLFLLAYAIFIVSYFMTKSFLLYAIFNLSLILLRIIFHIIFVKIWSGSPGKLLLKLKILRVDGSKISWKEAILRYIIDLIFSLVLCIIVILFIYYKNVNWGFINSNDLKIINDNLPIYVRIISIIASCWMYSEFFVLLLNKEKRGLQDFIAGTVVIVKEKTI